MSADIEPRYCDRCLPVSPDDRARKVWRFESRDGHMLRFRLWQFDMRLLPHYAHATTETYTVPEVTFWNRVERSPESLLAETLTGMVDADVWTALTCTEVEALALVLARAGFEGVAHRIIDAHAEGDELGDQHYQLMEASA